MRPEIENLRARIKGIPLNSYQKGLSKTEFVKLLDYVKELELRIEKSEKAKTSAVVLPKYKL